MGRGFYNTVNATGQFLLQLDKRAVSLEDKVMDQFLLNEQPNYTPYEMWCVLKKKGYNGPCSSVRRSMTNLSNGEEPKLEKLNIMRPGEFDTPNHAWALLKK